MNKSLSSVTLFALMLTACVTINIYFPAAAAEKVADEIVNEIQDDRVPKQPVEPEAGLSDWQRFGYQSLDVCLNFLFSSAHAGNANLDVDTAEIRQLRAAMKSRFNDLAPLYDKGYIGIQNDGLLTVRNPGAIPLKDRNRVNKLVNSENTDRKRLYSAIANANGHPEWAGQIQSTFANSWVSNAHPGWWYQSSNGSWAQK